MHHGGHRLASKVATVCRPTTLPLTLQALLDAHENLLQLVGGDFAGWGGGGKEGRQVGIGEGIGATSHVQTGASATQDTCRCAHTPWSCCHVRLCRTNSMTCFASAVMSLAMGLPALGRQPSAPGRVSKGQWRGSGGGGGRRGRVSPPHGRGEVGDVGGGGGAAGWADRDRVTQYMVDPTGSCRTCRGSGPPRSAPQSGPES
jgi:hypothetical protein